MNTPTPVPVRLVLVDDSEVVRLGLRTLLSPERSLSLVGEAASVAQAVPLVLQLKPHVVLMDIRLPDGTGFDACQRILSVEPQIRILFLTSVADDKLVSQAIQAGGHGYLLKEVDGQQLIQAIMDVAAGKSILDPAITARVLSLIRQQPAASRPFESLSPQERKVLTLIAEGKTNKEVGTDLGLSEKTVKNYLANIFDKLNVTRRSQAVALMMRDNHR